MRYEDPTGNIAWDTIGKGLAQAAIGGIQTTWGALQIATGVGLATGGTATGIAAAPGIAAGVGVGTLGANNVVGGGTTLGSGLANIFLGVTDQPSVDYSFDPAHEAINEIIPKGSENATAHIGYDIIDTLAGGFGIAKTVSAAKNEMKLIDTKKVLLKFNGGKKPDATLSLKKGGGNIRIHSGYHPIDGGAEFVWHFGIGTTSKTFIHLPAVPTLGGIGLLRGVLKSND